MKSKVYNVLIIGGGDIGAGYDTPNSKEYLTHAHAFTDHSGFNLVGFVEPNKEVAQNISKKWQVNCFNSIDEAFKLSKIDVVSIAVPDEVHYAVLKEVAKYHPKFVVAEKPLTQTISEAKEIVGIYAGIPSLVNFKRRFTPEFISLKQKIDNNVFGEFRYGSAFYGKGFIHNGSHLVNLLSYLINLDWDSFHKIDSVTDYKIEDPSLSILLKNQSEKTSFLIKSIHQNDFTIFDFDLIFSKGKIRITNLGNKIEEYQTVKNDVFTAFTTLRLKSDYVTELNKSLIYLADHIYEYLTQKTPLSCTFEEVYKEMIFTQKIKNSIQNV